MKLQKRKFLNWKNKIGKLEKIEDILIEKLMEILVKKAIYLNNNQYPIIKKKTDPKNRIR
jgi:hypothetical protein